MTAVSNSRPESGARRLYIVAAAICAALFAITVASVRAEPLAPRLKPVATVESDVVRLGDLIEGAGPAGDAAVFGAPQPGGSGVISTARILTAAREHGVAAVDANGLSTVTVRRLGRRIGPEEISRAVAAALIAEHGLNADLEVELNAGQMEALVESSAVEPVVIRHLSYNGASGRFEATFSIAGSRILELSPGKVVGNVADVMRVPVLARAILKGDLVTAGDIVMERRRRSDLAGDVFLDTKRIFGNAARRPLPRGTLLREADIQRPEIIEKNATVTMTFEQPGVQLTMRGKALVGGGMGDTIQVQNLNSRKTVEAVVTGPNRAAVTGAVLQQAAARNGAVTQ